MSLGKVMAAACALAMVATQGWSADPSAAAEAQTSADNIKAHVTFLASDLLEGREAGSRGYDIAAAYVASQMAQLGLKPGGDNGTYFQHVPMVAFQAADQGSFVLRDSAGKATPLVFGEDYLVGRNPVAASTSVAAPLVFVGFGVVAPEHRRDDYAGLDVKGKIVVALSGAPSAYQTEERAYYSSGRTKRSLAEARGAVGFIQVNTPGDEKLYPFANSARGWKSWGMSWRTTAGAAFAVAPGVPALASISVKGAEKLFAGAPVDLKRITKMAESKSQAPPRFVLPTTLEASFATTIKPVESSNVVGLIEGSDPVLRDQVVVLSAHLDHLGIGAPVKGDTINNGALDNAAGSAITLEVARMFMASDHKPKRTILFLLDTGEEKGLVGSEYFARNPTVPLASIVADVDLDMPILTYDFTDVIAFGAERSSIGPAARRAAAGMGLKLSPDPMPEEGLFTRSDHYRFVEVGVPAVFFMTGFANGGEKEFRTFLAERYHKPSDDLNQPISWLAGAKFARLNYEVTRELTDMAERPAWNKGDFFGVKYGRAP
ncbi:M28 family metallopeptidase [Phenylobacterium sp.]|uniref:M28 family metallopeptidase n=1 Tax=Phenylobacterium sp. TaxID=1871053 RepID=UPI0030F3D0E3